jgi:chromosome segregation ATPase
VDNDVILKLVESQSAELASLRQLVEERFQTVNWKLDRLVEVVDNLNNREHINNRRLSKLEDDVARLKTDVAAIKAKLSA